MSTKSYFSDRLSLVSFHVISELSVENPNGPKSLITKGLFNQRSEVSSDCKIDWYSILDSTLQGAVFGAIAAGVVGAMAGGLAGLGIISPLTGVLGAIAGAHLGALGGAAEEFLRALAWEGLKYSLCRLFSNED